MSQRSKVQYKWKQLWAEDTLHILKLVFMEMMVCHLHTVLHLQLLLDWVKMTWFLGHASPNIPVLLLIICLHKGPKFLGCGVFHTSPPVWFCTSCTVIKAPCTDCVFLAKWQGFKRMGHFIPALLNNKKPCLHLQSTCRGKYHFTRTCFYLMHFGCYCCCYYY